MQMFEIPNFIGSRGATAARLLPLIPLGLQLLEVHACGQCQDPSGETSCYVQYKVNAASLPKCGFTELVHCANNHIVREI
jgi:hypothetical protein